MPYYKTPKKHREPLKDRSNYKDLDLQNDYSDVLCSNKSPLTTADYNFINESIKKNEEMTKYNGLKMFMHNNSNHIYIDDDKNYFRKENITLTPEKQKYHFDRKNYKELPKYNDRRYYEEIRPENNENLHDRKHDRYADKDKNERHNDRINRDYRKKYEKNLDYNSSEIGETDYYNKNKKNLGINKKIFENDRDFRYVNKNKNNFDIDENKENQSNLDLYEKNTKDEYKRIVKYRKKKFEDDENSSFYVQKTKEKLRGDKNYKFDDNEREKIKTRRKEKIDETSILFDDLSLTPKKHKNENFMSKKLMKEMIDREIKKAREIWIKDKEIELEIINEKFQLEIKQKENVLVDFKEKYKKNIQRYKEICVDKIKHERIELDSKVLEITTFYENKIEKYRNAYGKLKEKYKVDVLKRYTNL